MRNRRFFSTCLGASLVLAGMIWPVDSIQAQAFGKPKSFDFPNTFGVARTVSSNGPLSLSGPFFQSLGSNGRSCVSCHQPAQGWSITPEEVQKRFNSTDGLDPIFRTNDGSNSPNTNVSTTAARKLAFSMLLTKGLIRVERPIPANADFELFAVDDPYHYASASGLSLFRRPLPSTNLRFISTVMWDGREVDPLTPMIIANAPEVNRGILMASLSHQALDATNGHAQAASDLTEGQRNAIVDFEMALATAQVKDNEVGSLTADGAKGGPENIFSLPFYIGINDNMADPNGPFNPESMSLYEAWKASSHDDRKSIARGQALFNTFPITISGVKGINDNPYFDSPTSFVGSCTTCHDTPNSGNHSLAVALDIGLTDASRRTPDMPLYTMKNKLTGALLQTTDPGLALSTGKWKDIGRFKGPVLRGLAARAPYFHNGSAKDLDAVLNFYQDRFGLTLSRQQRKDLKAFLVTL